VLQIKYREWGGSLKKKSKQAAALAEQLGLSVGPCIILMIWRESHLCRAD
jgi:hypothetical protein